MAEGWEAIHFHQSNCKKPWVQPLDPSHSSQSPKAVAIWNDYILKKATDSQRKFGSDKNGNPNYGWEVVDFFSWKYKKLTRSWPLDWRRYLRWRIKWDAPSSFELWTQHLEASHYTWPSWPSSSIALAIFIPFLWALNKVWLFNPMGSRLGWP